MMRSDGHRSELVTLSTVAAFIIAIGAVIYRNFLFGDQVLLYKDIGADSVNDYYPYFVHLSDYLRAHGFPSWSFSVGMGQSLYYLSGELFWDPVIWLGRHLIAPALVYQHLLKTLFAGLLMFGFLRLRGLVVSAACLGAILLCFSAYMCMGSCWFVNADETVAFIFVLFAVEFALGCGRWRCLPFAIGLLGLITGFHFYLCAVVLCAYLGARLAEQALSGSGFSVATYFSISAAALLGLGLSAVIWLPSLHSILNSPRGSGMIANFAFANPPAHIFQFDSSLSYFTAALRVFSNDILGSGDRFMGWENYFEGPTLYCGVLPLVLVPQAFIGVTKIRRIVYISVLCLLLIPIVFPWFRYLLWWFQGGYFRTFSLFCIFGLVTLTARALSEYLANGRLSLPLLAVTVLALILFLFLPVRAMQTLIVPGVRLAVATFLVLFGLILAAAHLLKRHWIGGWLIVLLSAVNLIYFNDWTVNRPSVTKSELSQRTGYNDYTVEAVRDLKANDSGFFRVTKMWGSGPANRISYNDAMIFGYFGTPCYSSFNSLDYIRFLIAVEAIPSDNIPTDAQWSPGLLWEPLVSTLACEKYAITNDPQRFESAEQYEFLKQYQDVYVFRNNAFVPLGLVFEQWFDESAFLGLPKWLKAQALLHAAVWNKKAERTEPLLPQMSLEEMKQRLRDVPVTGALAQRRATALKLTHFRESVIEGEVELDKSGMLVFQMSFDNGWRASVDDRQVRTTRIDVGLLGLELTPGRHVVRLKYFPPLFYSGLSITLVSFVSFLIAQWKWPRV